MGDVGMAIQRAEDKTAQMRARAGALDELMASGALDDMVSGPHDDIQAELDRMGAGHGVDQQLAQMKAELAQSEAPRQIENSANGDGSGEPASAATAVEPGQAGEPE
jgi:phage shock protein A